MDGRNLVMELRSQWNRECKPRGAKDTHTHTATHDRPRALLTERWDSPVSRHLEELAIECSAEGGDYGN